MTSLPVILTIAAVVLLLVALIAWGIAVYNRLVTARNRSTEALRGIDVALETRYDQVKAQADAASGVVKKELDLVLGATALRTGRRIDEMSVQEKSDLNGAMQKAESLLLGGVDGAPGQLASFEQYPEMQSTQNVELLQRTINETEERLQAARRTYNGAATDYNTKRQVFPTVLIAGVLGFSQHDLFEITNAVKREQHDLKGFLDS